MGDGTQQGGTALVAGDEITTDNGATVSARQAQRIKVDSKGVDGAFTDTSASNPFPVALRDSAQADAVGDVTASPAANTILGRLKALLTGIILAAGEAHIGAVGGNSVVASAVLTRLANTTAYAQGQLVANNATAGSVTPLALAVARVTGGTGALRRIRLATSHTGLAGTDIFRVHLYRTSPTVVNGDGGAFSANGVASVEIGFVDVTLNQIESDGAKGWATVDWLFAAAGGSQNVYGLIEVRNAAGYTPISAEVFTLEAEALQD